MEEFREFTGKTVEDAITNASVALGLPSSELEIDILDKGSNGRLFGIGAKDAVINARIRSTSCEDIARDFLDQVFDKMGLTVNIEMLYNDEESVLSINLSGDHMGLLIGKRGQTLDSLQYLTSLVINKGHDNYIRVKLDTEDYRHRRKETLENLARNVAYKAKKTHRSQSLEPMTAYERRIIHTALQDDDEVTTFSEGEEPYRHVVIDLKR
ncbi:RNA-binding cell elongation regulator Jag/EloR [Candidatus Weimeria sp. HCP3S3_B5]|uniref:RNA-binding cell elongation regulator Jag/EloR n=1 Tax=Candidatus Weimeria sp. HCP3S3_B5 TaxID=3438871 RepID=UPI002A93BE27|nr:protein jag [Lachnospiraceae bacterium]MDY6353152.1 RNA-binding cell elongation regulator Jag/EloR [Lachnospiraceae bacterium]